MLTFCTVGDKDYILKGLSLYRSLKETISEDFKLHWLCIDDKTYDTLCSLIEADNTFSHIRCYSLSVLEYGFPELLKAKQNPKSNYGTQHSQYCWCLTPWFTNYILHNKVAINGYLLYVDNDLYFYQSPKIVLDAMNGKSVGIHTHRFGGRKEDHQGDNGWYNVGVVVFKNNTMGVSMSNIWRQWLLTTDHQYYKSHGTCGDQKYLDLFQEIMPNPAINLSVFDMEGDLLHYAPWCTHNPKNQMPLFFHFSHFTYNIEANSWSDSIEGEWAPAREPSIKQYYEAYFETIKDNHKKISTTL